MLLIIQLIKSYLLLAALFLAGRLTLLSVNFSRLHDASIADILFTFIYGLRMDSIVICAALVIPVAILSLTPERWQHYASQTVRVLWIGLFVFLTFIENATIPFFLQYDVRPNYIFIEYLNYPKEVVSMLLKDYKLYLLTATLLMIAAGYFLWNSAIINYRQAFQTSYAKRLALMLPIAAILVMGIRSSFGHRPANISDALHSSNRIVNEITKNSIHSIISAYKSNKKQGSRKVARYGKMQPEEAYRLASEVLNIPLDSQQKFHRLEKTHFNNAKPKNLVIFIQESMGAQFVSFTGGEKQLTPAMNDLGNRYLAFTDLYSNGTRSIRGISGLTAGFLPIPGEGVVKRNKSQSNFFTVAQLLKPFGYKSCFIYGGEARFDNMKSWFLGNGFDEVIEQKDYITPLFVSTWGVSDEDLVIKANERFKTYAQQGERFVSVLFSSSNHEPFELPEGKITFEKNEPKQSVRNAIKYADYAIGKFFELARKESYYKDTVFVVASDHNVRVYGDDVVPVNMFHIPAVIVADGGPSLKYTRPASQPDVLATALDLLGLDLSYPILGQSIFSKTKQDVVLMQFNDTYALRKNNEIAVLLPDKPPQTYTYKDKRLIPASHNALLERQALALVFSTNDLYEKQLYKLYK